MELNGNNNKTWEGYNQLIIRLLEEHDETINKINDKVIRLEERFTLNKESEEKNRNKHITIISWWISISIFVGSSILTLWKYSTIK